MLYVQTHAKKQANDYFYLKCGVEDESFNMLLLSVPLTIQTRALVETPSSPLVFHSSSAYTNTDYLF